MRIQVTVLMDLYDGLTDDDIESVMGDVTATLGHAADVLHWQHVEPVYSAGFEEPLTGEPAKQSESPDSDDV